MTETCALAFLKIDMRHREPTSKTPLYCCGLEDRLGELPASMNGWVSVVSGQWGVKTPSRHVQGAEAKI